MRHFRAQGGAGSGAEAGQPGEEFGIRPVTLEMRIRSGTRRRATRTVSPIPIFTRLRSVMPNSRHQLVDEAL